jgi:hypothetical protein
MKKSCLLNLLSHHYYYYLVEVVLVDLYRLVALVVCLPVRLAQ